MTRLVIKSKNHVVNFFESYTTMYRLDNQDRTSANSTAFRNTITAQRESRENELKSFSALSESKLNDRRSESSVSKGNSRQKLAGSRPASARHLPTVDGSKSHGVVATSNEFLTISGISNLNQRASSGRIRSESSQDIHHITPLSIENLPKSRPSTGRQRKSLKESTSSTISKPEVTNLKSDGRTSKLESHSFKSDPKLTNKTKSLKKKISKSETVLPPWNISTRTVSPHRVSINPVVIPSKMLTEEHDERDPTAIDIDRDIPEEIRSPIFSPSTSAAEFMSPILPNFKRSYHATPYQLEICTRLLPAADEQDNLPTQSSSDYIISQAYVLSQSLLLLNVQNIINKLCYEYPILTTTVYRNPKIIDADIECYLEYTPWEDIPKERFTEVIKLEDSKNAEKAIWETAQEWITKRKIDETFKLLIIECPATSQSYFIFSASLIIMDEISLLWLSKKFFSLYDASVQGSDLSNYNCEEQDTFEDLTYNTVRLKSDISFWRDQCIQVSQDSINFEEKKTLEVQLRMLEKERVTLKTALQSATKQRAEYEKSLTNLRKQRLAIDQDNTGKGAKSSFTDPTTGEVCIISKTTKDALIKTVLGDEAVGENVIPLLAKHDVSKEIQRKINAASLNLENFAAITEMTIDNLYLENRDHRKILALIDYVRNRIKECIQEQGKVKFVLEREIAKSSRGFEASSNKVKISRDNLEANEDLAFRLNNILHPPYIENIIECLSLKNLYDTFTDPTTVNLNRWGFQSFNISGEMLDNLRKFRSDWTLNIRNKKRLAKKKAFLDQSSDNDSLLEDDNDEDEKDKNQRRLLEHSVDAVCLAAFGVLMKHISGINQFTIGVNCSFRTPGLILGPLTDILPVKIDLTKKGISFTALFASLYKVFKQIRRHGPGCPFGYISKTLKIPAEFPIQFEFISLAEKRDWQALGFSVADLISPHERTALHFANLKAERVWTTNQQTNYDMKFIMVECEDTIECGVRYRSDRFEQEKILKWITKYQSTLEGIDCSRRKISVSSMISRYYHPLWQSSSLSNIQSMTNLSEAQSYGSLADSIFGSKFSITSNLSSTDMLNSNNYLASEMSTAE